MNFNIFQWRYLRSLKTRVTLFTLAIFLLSLWLLTFYANRILHRDMQRLLGDQQLSTATLAAENVNEKLSDRLAVLEVFAKVLTPAFLGNTAKLQTALEQRPFLLSLFNAGVIVLNPEGQVIAAVPSSADSTGVNFMDSDYVVAAIRDGKSTIGRPVLAKKQRVPCVNMAVPIRNAQGKVIGAVAGLTHLGTANFLDTISQGHYGKTGGFLLVAPQYRLIVTASDKRRVMEELPAPGIDPLIDRRVLGQEGTEVFVNPRGVEVLSSSKQVPAAGWFLVVSLPTEEAFAPIRDVLQRLLLATLFLTLLAGALTWWMLRRQLAPLLATVKTLAVLVQSNQYPQPLPITRPDEIGELIAGFNHLLAELGQRGVLLKQILDTSSVAIFLVDLQGRITQANQRMAQMFGYPVDGLLGREYVALVDPAERDEARQKMLALLASAIPAVDLDRRYWRADRTEFWGHLSGKRFIDTDGQEHGLIGVIADISQRKSTEEKLLQHTNMLSAIIENFPGGLSMMDADLRLTTYNKAFKQLLDFPDALFEKPALHLEDVLRYNAQRGEYGPGDVEEQVASRVERARNFEPHKFERVRPDGTVLEIHGEPVPGGGFVTIYLDITERKRMEKQVHQLVFYDPLTKLPNRRLLGDRLSQAIAAGKRSGRYGALMFLDLDNFKALNDAHGHAVGDLLLVQAAKRMKACVREVDTVARLGGDEFVVMVGDLNADPAESTAQAGLIAKKVRNALAEPYRLTVKHDEQADAMVEHQCTASVGVVMFIDKDGSQDDFLRRADSAMYQAKEAGPNLIRFYETKT